MGDLSKDIPGREVFPLRATAPVTTCFRPTAYLPMHLGSAWCAYHNWALPARMGGRFLLVLDEEEYRLQRCENSPGALSMDEAEDLYMEDLAWLGCPADACHRSSEARPLLLEAAARLNIKEPQIVRPEHVYEGMVWRYLGQAGPEVVQYNPWTTLAALADHRYFGVSGFYRGMDMVHQMDLYDYLWGQLGWGQPPQQFYIPLVRRGWGMQKESKSYTGSPVPSLRDYREAGLTGEEIIDTLRELDFRMGQEGRDALNIPNDVLQVPVRPGTLAYHLKEVPA